MIKTAAGLFKVAAIGSVCTAPEFRNNGYGLKVLESCLDGAKQERCDFAILWTDLYDFYRKLDFELSGTEVGLSMSRRLNVEQKPLRFLHTERVSPQAILNSYNQHTVTTLRNSEDIRRFLSIPKTEVYTAWDNDNKLLAYAIEGKGSDLANYIHEWGGDTENLIQLLNFIHDTKKTPITLIAPVHSQNLISKVQDVGGLSNYGYLGMIKPIDTTNLFFKVRRYARALGFSQFILEEKNGKYYFGNETQVFSTDDIKDVTRLIFGPQKASEIYDFDENTKLAFETVLPIPMWLWGWDSV